MQKLINFFKTPEKLSPVISVLILALTLMTIFPEVASASYPRLLSSTQIGFVPGQISAESLKEVGNYRFTLFLFENLGSFQNIRQISIVYMFGGIGVVVFILLLYWHINVKKLRFAKDSLKALYSHNGWRASKTEENIHEKFEIEKIRLCTATPVLCIALAEILIFLGKPRAAICMHIGTLIALSLASFTTKNFEVSRIYQALMFLPVLRLINLSMPVFFETKLYAFIFIYTPLAIPVAVILIHDRDFFEEMGITTRNLLTYIVLSVPLSFLLGFGEYLTIRTGYMIPDLSLESLLKLTIIMVFFVGLVEELIFRSIIQSRLEHALNVREALLITSILLGLMHSGYGTFYEVLYTGFVGLFIGFIFYRTKSLPFVVILHGFINVFLYGILPHYLSGLIGL